MYMYISATPTTFMGCSDDKIIPLKRDTLINFKVKNIGINIAIIMVFFRCSCIVCVFLCVFVFVAVAIFFSESMCPF